jgi:hypothetical protein
VNRWSENTLRHWAVKNSGEEIATEFDVAFALRSEVPVQGRGARVSRQEVPPGLAARRQRPNAGVPGVKADFQFGDCVTVPDGRTGRVRGRVGTKYRIRVRRITSETHQFLFFSAVELQPVDCPKGWMTPEGYRRYLRVTLAKQRSRLRNRRRQK